MITDVNGEDRLVQKTFSDYLEHTLGWESAFDRDHETFERGGNLGRDTERDAVLKRDLRAALARLNPALPESERDEAFQKLMLVDYSRSLVQNNQQFHRFIRDGVPVSWRDPKGRSSTITPRDRLPRVGEQPVHCRARDEVPGAARPALHSPRGYPQPVSRARRSTRSRTDSSVRGRPSLRQPRFGRFFSPAIHRANVRGEKIVMTPPMTVPSFRQYLNSRDRSRGVISITGKLGARSGGGIFGKVPVRITGYGSRARL